MSLVLTCLHALPAFKMTDLFFSSSFVYVISTTIEDLRRKRTSVYAYVFPSPTHFLDPIQIISMCVLPLLSSDSWTLIRTTKIGKIIRLTNCVNNFSQTLFFNFLVNNGTTCQEDVCELHLANYTRNDPSIIECLAENGKSARISKVFHIDVHCKWSKRPKKKDERKK